MSQDQRALCIPELLLRGTLRDRGSQSSAAKIFPFLLKFLYFAEVPS